MSHLEDIKVAVLGAGPSGIFAAADLLRKHPAVTVDVYDRLPTPYGLLRYGVAPDHLKMKTIDRKFHKILENPRIRFVGNVEIGVDLDSLELGSAYNAVIVAAGAPGSRRLEIAGEDLPGSISAAQFVAWYNGHPDSTWSVPADVRDATVIGAGNVALDVSRVLLKGATGLDQTDVPQHVLETLNRHNVHSIQVVARRGVAQAKFTLAELLEFEAMADLDIVVDPADLSLSEEDHIACERSPQLKSVVDKFADWSRRSPVGAAQRIKFKFWTSPQRLTGENRVEGIALERNTSQITTSGDRVDSYVDDTDLVISAVGYKGRAIHGLPFDTHKNLIPNDKGRVTPPIANQAWYVTGWIKRGPSGVIGTNKQCSAETVETLLSDLHAGLVPSEPRGGKDAIQHRLHDQSIPTVDWDGWERIEAAEIAGGKARGRARTKIHDRVRLLSIAGHRQDSGAD